MQQIKDFAEWIEASKQGIRKRDVKIVQPIPSLILAYKAISGLQSGVYDHAPLTSVCSNIGKLVCLEYEAVDATMEEINVRRVNVGYHLLNILFENNKIKLRRGKTTREPYTIEVVDDEWIDTALYTVNVMPMDVKLHSKPIFDEPLQYTSFKHPILGDLVRKCNPDVKSYFTYDNCPAVFDVINKHMRTPYVVNQDVLSTINNCKQDDVFTFRDKTLDPDARIGIKREQTGVLDQAESIEEKVFYQGMFYDFRGRLYSSLIYFSPQGSKLSKSLFYFKDKKKLGSEGWFWMLVDAANKWGEDKLSLDDGYQFAKDRLDEWLVWAEDPTNPASKGKKDDKGNIIEDGWQVCDDPWGFLASILEIRKAVNHPEGKENFESGLIVAWDATCSGLQVLSALTRDKEAGKLCNLTGTQRGDYYKMIAEEVWEDCKFTEEDINVARGIDYDLTRLSNAIKNAASKTAKKTAIEEIKFFMSENREDIRTATKVFWGHPDRAELKRKIVKRPCMTYFYSCQPKTMSKQLFNDFKSEPEFAGLQMSYCYWLCNRIYKACRERMPIATRMMDAWIEMGKKDYSDGKDFTIIGPYNKFKLMQYYRNPITKKVKVYYKGNPIQLKVLIDFSGNITYSKVLSATSPNVVHMLDSQIVASVVMNADYPINCIHDSFSTTPADAGSLYEDTRTCFVDIFEEDLLYRITEDKGYDTDIELGDLDINDVLDNEYFTK